MVVVDEIERLAEHQIADVFAAQEIVREAKLQPADLVQPGDLLRGEAHVQRPQVIAQVR